MLKTTFIRYFFYIIECFEIPVLKRNRPNINKKIENFILLLWIIFIMYVSFHQLYGENGINSLKLNNNFTIFMVSFFHVEAISIYIYILLQKRWKNLHIVEDKLWQHIQHIDQMFMSYLQYKSIPNLSENKYFLLFTIDSIIFVCLRNIGNILCN